MNLEAMLKTSRNTNYYFDSVKKCTAGSTSSRQAGYEAKDPQRSLREETRERR